MFVNKSEELHLKWLHKEVFIPENCKLFRNFKFQNCRVNIKADVSSLDYLLYSFYACTLLMVRNLLFLYMIRGNYEIFLSYYRVTHNKLKKIRGNLWRRKNFVVYYPFLLNLLSRLFASDNSIIELHVWVDEKQDDHRKCQRVCCLVTISEIIILKIYDKSNNIPK